MARLEVLVFVLSLMLHKHVVIVTRPRRRLPSGGILSHGSSIVFADHETHGVSAADSVTVVTQKHEEPLSVPARVRNFDESEALLSHSNDLAVHGLAERQHATRYAILALDQSRTGSKENLGARIQLGRAGR